MVKKRWEGCVLFFLSNYKKIGVMMGSVFSVAKNWEGGQ